MGQKTVGFDSTGAFQGFFDSDDYPLPDGMTGVDISYDDWQSYLVKMNTANQTLTLGPDNELVFTDPAAPTGDALIAINTTERNSLMAVANEATVGMSDAYVAGLLDDADTATFKAWAKYKLALSKVDLTQATPTWPSAPA